jgi:hypothetical protein
MKFGHLMLQLDSKRCNVIKKCLVMFSTHRKGLSYEETYNFKNGCNEF